VQPHSTNNAPAQSFRMAVPLACFSLSIQEPVCQTKDRPPESDFKT
jgi:hypothetical protein